ncbi:hypothetical protein B0H13DRAFT_2326757 [Mycena leptocephala]|nr:hypothetical protein B0H13DRAFT_2326757 [Mycena leptocephala]
MTTKALARLKVVNSRATRRHEALPSIPAPPRAMLRLPGILTFVLLVNIPGINAQAGQLFEWGFSGKQEVSNSLPSCRTFPITVDPLTAHGVPPFYMIAFEVGGAPTTSFIGTNASNLAWTVRHPVVLLGVVDSEGNSGGIDALCTPGRNNTVYPPCSAEPAFKITANVTDTLTTCEPWGLTIHGGTPPYNLTLAALNSPDVTNVTLGPNDSVFTYINRAYPGTQMIASVSDLNGRWATGSPFLQQRGSDSAGSYLSIHPPRHNRNHRRRVRGGLLLCGLGTWVILRRRRLRRSQDEMTAVAPFRTWPNNWQTQTGARVSPPASAFMSKGLAHKQSHTTISLTPTSEWRSSRASSPAASPQPVFVQELPPPYAYPQLY